MAHCIDSQLLTMLIQAAIELILVLSKTFMYKNRWDIAPRVF